MVLAVCLNTEQTIRSRQLAGIFKNLCLIGPFESLNAGHQAGAIEIDSSERQPFNLALVIRTNAEPGDLLAQSADSALQARLKGSSRAATFSSLRAMFSLVSDAFLFFQLPAQYRRADVSST